MGIMFPQAHDAEAGAETLLWMGSALQDGGDERFGHGTMFFGPSDQPGGSPFQVFLMRLGHVLGQGGKPALTIASLVTSHPFVFEENFHDGRGQAHLHMLPAKLMGNAVEVIPGLDMVVDVDQTLFPLGILIGGGRQGFESELIDGLEEAPSCAVEFFEFAVIEVLEFLGDAVVEI